MDINPWASLSLGFGLPQANCGVTFTEQFEGESPDDSIPFECRDDLTFFQQRSDFQLGAGLEMTFADGKIGVLPNLKYYQWGQQLWAPQFTDDDLIDARHMSMTEQGVQLGAMVTSHPVDRVMLGLGGGFRYGLTRFGTGTPSFGFGQKEEGEVAINYPVFDLAEQDQHSSFSFSPTLNAVVGARLASGLYGTVGLDVVWQGGLQPGQEARTQGGQFIQEGQVGDNSYHYETVVTRGLDGSNVAPAAVFLTAGIAWGKSGSKSNSSSSTGSDLGGRLGSEGLPEE